MRRSLLVALVLAAATTSAVQAAVDCFLTIEAEIATETSSKRFRGRTKVASVQHELPGVPTWSTINADGLPRTPRHGTADGSSFTFIKQVDRSSPHLSPGRRLKRLVLKFQRKTPQGTNQYFRYDLKNVLITSIGPNDAHTDLGETEGLTLAFEKLKWKCGLILE